MSEEKKALDVQTAKRRLEVLGKAMAKARMEATKATEADMDKAERFEGKEDLVRYEFESPLAKSPLAQTVDKTLQDINGVFKKHRVLKWISVLGVSALAYAPYEYQRYQKTGKTLMDLWQPHLPSWLGGPSTPSADEADSKTVQN